MSRLTERLESGEISDGLIAKITTARGIGPRDYITLGFKH